MKQKTKKVVDIKEVQDKSQREIVKVTNPDYLLKEISPMVYEFAGKINLPGISYESLMSYFLYSAGIEVYVGLVDGKPKGFMSIGIMGAPYYSTAIVHSIYKPEPDPILADMMYDTFADFMKTHKLIYHYYIAVDKKTGKYFADKAKERNITATCMGYYFSGKRTFKR
ncbi:MAG: hypothetical protein GWN00_24835 [Aliifodinibius sp.]|nr:hypothetical protein [Fodinibius sp.]NIV14092.1 hypothetical protein [Fodinibius sp.]NIY27912.1 hypothetical protein [Fodinibius sp.]